jgi:hypothetical protein
VTWERKENEGHLAHLDNQGLLDLKEHLGVLEVLATQVSLDLTILKAGSITYSMALTSWDHLCKEKVQSLCYKCFCSTLNFKF